MKSCWKKKLDVRWLVLATSMRGPSQPSQFTPKNIIVKGEVAKDVEVESMSRSCGSLWMVQWAKCLRRVEVREIEEVRVSVGIGLQTPWDLSSVLSRFS